jgi:uncharacterized membrane protein
MLLEQFLRWLHVIGATVLLGTGAGIAFFMLMAHRTGNARIIAHTAKIVVLADWIFTASAVIIQPITGSLLALQIGWKLTEPWILVSIGLYIFIGAFWMPVVFIQKKMQTLAEESIMANRKLPERYYRLFNIWLACGFPAFFAMLGIIALMIMRPQFG